MKRDADDRLQQLDECIRSGRDAEARAALDACLRDRLPRSQHARLADLCLRVGAPEAGLKLLNAAVRGKGRAKPDADEAERIAYGACLVRIGALVEGMRLLEKEDADRHPQILFTLYMGAAAQWEYATGIELLRRYLRRPDLPGYSRRVAQANLAAALVYERRHQEATLLLDELSEAAKAPGQEKLLAVVTDYTACNYLLQRRFADARRLLDSADRLFRGMESLDAFFSRKWRAVLDLCERPEDVEARAGVETIRREARARKHWETVRDCDRYEALARRDVPLARHVCYGTRHRSFRERLLADWKGPLDLGASYGWAPGGVASAIVDCRALESASEDSGTPALLHSTLAALAADFYRPLRVAALHDLLFVDEWYNPRSSPHRVHEAVNRTRKWLDGQPGAFRIVEEDGTYRLESEGRGRLWVPLEPPRPALKEELPDFAATMGTAPFSAKECAARMQLPPRSAQRLLERAVAAGHLEKEGASRATRYVVAGLGARRRA